MATNLTPQQMAELQRLFGTPTESGDGNAYMPEYVYMDGRTYDKQDSGFLGYDYNPNDFTDPRTQEHQSLFNGQSYDQYGQGGNFTNSGTFTGIEDSNKLGEFLTALTMAAGPVLGGMAMGAGGAAGSGGMVNGAFLGEGALSGIGAWDGALAAAGAGGAAGAAGAGEMVNGAFLGEGAWTPTAGGALDFGAAGAAGAGGAGGAAGSSSLLDTAIKYAPGIIGAIAGGKSGNGGRGEMDPRLQSLLYGDDKTKGGFSYARGLLDAPVAPNGFERFYGGK